MFKGVVTKGNWDVSSIGTGEDKEEIYVAVGEYASGWERS